MMALLAHMTKEASDAIGQLMLVLGLAALTVLVFAIWGLVALIRFLTRDDGSDGEDRERPE